MCGFAGYIDRDLRPGLLPVMLGRIAHRGPDGEGQWTSSTSRWQVALGHRRLAIIDLETGAQPLGAGNSQIIFNGEIYNYRELRAGLTGVSFRTESDTEVLFELLKAFEAEEALRRLNGMFAFAFWHQDSLLLARDRAGIKPLYYAELPGGGLAFGSELAALLEHPGIAKRVDHESLAQYFFLDYSLPPRSLIQGVKKLEPGTFVRWQNGKLSAPEKYWELQERPLAEEPRPEDLRQRLSLAVQRQLVADVPVGVLLSGGLDSSLVAALARPHVKGPLRTFSIGFEDPSYDESAYARRMARELGSQHTEKIFSETDLIERAEKVLDALDEPLADPSLLPTSLLAEVAAAEVKVALGGDGGDELWAGYPTYRAHRYANWYARLPSVVQRSAAGVASALPVRHGYQSFEWKAKRFTQRWDEDPLLRHFRWMSGSDLPALGQLGLTVDRFWRELPRFRDSLNQELALDFSTYMPGSVLTKVDRASMAHGLEVRPPFLDADFVDWSFSVPSSWKLRGGLSKFLLKKAAEGLLPPEIIYRRKKGFGIPLAPWLNGPLAGLVDQTLTDSPLWNFLPREPFAIWRTEHRALKADHSKTLWAMVVLDRWAQRFDCHS